MARDRVPPVRPLVLLATAPRSSLPPPIPGLRFDVLRTGEIEVKGDALLDSHDPRVTPAEHAARFVPALAYLIRHPTRGTLLIDTGFGPAFVDAPSGDLGWYTRRAVHTRVHPGEDLIARLASLGVTPKDLSAVVLTHAHVDHTGGLPALGAVRVIVGKEEPATLDRPLALLDGIKSAHLAQAGELRTVDFDAAPEVPGLGRAVDLLGDGSVWLLDTRGHTPGHLSVLVNLEGGPVLLTGDAVTTHRGLVDAIPSGHAFSKDGARTAALRVRTLTASLHPARVFTGHDDDSSPGLAPVALGGQR